MYISRCQELQHQIIALGEDFWEASATYPSVLARWQATGGGFYQRPLQVVEVHRLVRGADSWTTWIRGHSHENWCFFHVSFSDDLEEQTPKNMISDHHFPYEQRRISGVNQVNLNFSEPCRAE